MKYYGKLRELIRIQYGSITRFNKVLKMKPVTLSRKLSGTTEWKSSEIEKISSLLGIPKSDIHAYFFYE